MYEPFPIFPFFCVCHFFQGIFFISGFQAIRRTARAVEKLADSLREELPATMAAVRLSGMEISDLTMELSDLRCPFIKRFLSRLSFFAGQFLTFFGSFSTLFWWFSSQEITEGVRSSARAVQAAEDGLKRIKSFATTQTRGFSAIFCLQNHIKICFLFLPYIGFIPHFPFPQVPFFFLIAPTFGLLLNLIPEWFPLPLVSISWLLLRKIFFFSCPP